MTTTVRLSRIYPLASKVLSVFLVLAFVLAVLPQAAAAQTSSNCAKNYTVVSGDTLSKVAEANKTTVLELATANNLKDPYPLTVGQVLCIPGTASTTTSGTSSTTATTTTTSTSTGPDFTITFDGKYVTLVTANFPTKSNFFVRAGEGRFKDYRWMKIGRIRTEKTGGVTVTYKLPKQFLDATSLTFCVKNAISDDVLCKRASTGLK